MAIEPGEQRHGEAVVEAVAFDHVAVGLREALDLADHRATEQRLGDDRPRDELGGVPAERERRARCTAAQAVRGAWRQADAGGRLVDGGALGDAFEKAALAVGGPAVDALAILPREGVDGRCVDTLVLESGGHLRMVRASAVQRSRLAAISGDTGMRVPIRPASTCACQAMTWRTASGRWSGIGGSQRGLGAGTARLAKWQGRGSSGVGAFAMVDPRLREDRSGMPDRGV